MIEQLSSREVYKNRWMRVREDEVRFADGSTGIFGVVEKVDFVVVIPRHNDGTYELVEQYRYPVKGRFWEFPMGAWETRPDAELIDVAHGELGEEVGLMAREMTCLASGIHEASGHSTQCFSVYLATGLTTGSAQYKRDHEEQDLKSKRFTMDDIKAMIRSGQIKDQTTITAFGLLVLMEDNE